MDITITTDGTVINGVTLKRGATATVPDAQGQTLINAGSAVLSSMPLPVQVKSLTTTLSSLKRTLAALTPIPFETRSYKLRPPNWASGDYIDTNSVVDTNDNHLYVAHGALTTANGTQSTVAPSLTTAGVWYAANKPAGALLQPMLAQGSWTAPNNWSAPTPPFASAGNTSGNGGGGLGWIDMGVASASRFDNATDPVKYEALSASPGGTDIKDIISGNTYYGKRVESASITQKASSGAPTFTAGLKNSQGQDLGGYASLEIISDTPWIGWRAPNFEFPVMVDTQQVSPGSVSYDGATYANFNNATNAYRKLTFTGSTKLRKIRLHGAGTANLTNIYIPTTAGVYFDVVHNKTNNWLMVTDSYGANPQAAGLYGSGVGRYVADELGLPYPVDASVGGTGLVKDSNTNAGPEIYTRLMLSKADHKLKNYVMAVLTTSGNDRNYMPNYGTYQLTLKTLDLVREILGPGVPIFMVEHMSHDATQIAANDSLTVAYLAQVKQAIADFNNVDGAVYYLPVSFNRPGGPLLSGNAYYYIGYPNVHPFDNGQLLWGREIAAQIKALANAAP